MNAKNIADLVEVAITIFNELGGAAIIVAGLITFLGQSHSKRQISKYQKQLEQVKSDNNKQLEEVKGFNEEQLEKLKNELSANSLKYEAYNSISKEEYQKLFRRKVKLYEKLLIHKRDIQKLRVDNSFSYEYGENHHDYYEEVSRKIVEEYKQNSLLMSEKLAIISEKLANIYDSITETVNSNEDRVACEAQNDMAQVIEAGEKARQEYTKLDTHINNWIDQLDSDISDIRKILDLSGEFLKNE